jgi:uncharacterized protein (DUF1684 family)
VQQRSGVLAIVITLAFIFCVSCTKNRPVSSTNAYFQPDSIAALRMEKDKYWREGEGSPLTKSDKELFQGLTYFPPSESYCVLAHFEVFAKADTVRLQTSDNEVRDMLRSGRAYFVIGKDSCALTAYRYTGIEGKMQQGYFVPFKDASNGTDTYRPGRYVEGVPLGVNGLLLDFNRAYNPYCNYNEQFSCPLVPQENVLAVKIEAGEKIFFHPRK